MLRSTLYRYGGMGIVAAALFISGVKASDGVVRPSEQIQWVQAKNIECKAIQDRVENLLTSAKEEKETIKITCLEDKVAQISAGMRGIEERTASLRSAHDAGRTEEANQHFSIVKIYLSRIAGLGAEADNCLGETDIVLGKTETIVTIDGDTDVDPSRDYTESVDIVDPSELDHASGYY